jgi:hypothetical protein
MKERRNDLEVTSVKQHLGDVLRRFRWVES